MKVSEVMKLLETVSTLDEVEGLVERYREVLTTPKVTQILIDRLEEERERLRSWKSVRELIVQKRREVVGELHSQIEAAVHAVLQAEGIDALNDVIKMHPAIYTANFLNAFSNLGHQARAQGEDYTARLIESRLRHLQMIQLASLQELPLTETNLRTIVFQILEARNLRDLLERIEEYPVSLSEAFVDVLTDMAREGAIKGNDALLVVGELRKAVLERVRRIIETVVTGTAAEGGPEQAVAELGKAQDAENLLDVCARYPFVLGEDFGGVMERELNLARADGAMDAVKGLERRIGHLEMIGRIVTKLTAATDASSTEPPETDASSTEPSDESSQS